MMKLPENHEGPILMLNMVKFKDKQLYFDGYLPAFDRVLAQLGIEGAGVRQANTVIASLIADEGEVWDAIVLVEYPDINAFRTVAESDAYRDIAGPLRIASVEEWKLFMTIKM
jgi:uncharacterized protein (DUF1330 family)